MERRMEVVVGQPSVVAVGPPREKRWGFYQFPSFQQTRRGELVVSFQVADDSHDDAGERHPFPHLVTHDAGRTWEPLADPGAIQTARVLADGTEIQAIPGPKRAAKQLGIQPVCEHHPDHYGNQFDLYRYDDLPDDMKGIRTLVRPPGGVPETVVAPLDFPGLLVSAYRLTNTSSGPVELEGNIYPLSLDLRSTACLEMPDGTLLYTCGFMRVDEQGALLPGMHHTYLLASEDRGRSWALRSTVAMIPQEAAYGLYEQTLTRLESGTLVCVMRSEEGGPPQDPRNLWISTSADGGHTWRKPWILNHFGVEPELLSLENGVTAVSYGRPGVEIRFSCDADGKVWTDPCVVRQGLGIADYHTTCGYTKLFATGPDRFLIAYSDFQHLNEDGQQRKAIKVREVVVR